MTMSAEDMRQTRRQRKLTQAQLGQLFGVTALTVGNVERGSSASGPLRLLWELLAEGALDRRIHSMIEEDRVARRGPRQTS